MGKPKFDRKKALRFQLVMGVDRNGKPTVIFEPLDHHKSKLAADVKQKMMKELTDVQEILVNGRPATESDIPAFVLQQLKENLGKHHQLTEEDYRDMRRQLQEDQQILDYEEYSKEERQLMMGSHQIMENQTKQIEEDEEENEFIDQEEDQWIDQDYEEEIIEKQINIKKNISEQIKKEKTTKLIIQQFPSLNKQLVQIDGQSCLLTPQQIKLLNTVIPQNYQSLDFGFNFKKFDENGLLLSDKHKYQRFLVQEDENRVILESISCAPTRSVYIDNDLKANQIQGDMKQVQSALDYEGNENVFEQLQDDFFVKMIALQKQSNSNLPKKQKKIKNYQKKEQHIQITEQMLARALQMFQKNQQEPKGIVNCQIPTIRTDVKLMNYKDLDNKEEYKGKDGQMDWRLLTKAERKQYAKTRIVGDFQQQLIEQQIMQKTKDRPNISLQDLHLKQRTGNISYSDDHVYQAALQRELIKEANGQYELDQPPSQREDSSDDENIISYHQRTSIIASNLTIIEQPHKIREKKQKLPPQDNIVLNKVAPEIRKRTETSTERKERKQRIKEAKKQKRQQKHLFQQAFDKQRRTVLKRDKLFTPFIKIH